MSPVSPHLVPTPQLQLFDLVGRRLLVVGLGESGLAMARWGASKGARVRVADTRESPPALEALRRDVSDVEFVAGPLDVALLEGVDLVGWSPGLSFEQGASAEFHRAASERVPVVGEIELFAQALAALRDSGYAPKLLAITGTNGKTTTARLLGHLLEQSGRNTRVAGNIGPAALDALREAIAADALPDVWVLELSSFQLALSHTLHPDAATILNVTQDHLDWHASMVAYAAAKQRIYAQGTIAVWNREDSATAPQRPIAPPRTPTHGRARRASDVANAEGAAAASAAAPGVSAAARGSLSFGLDAPAAIGDFGIVEENGIAWLAEGVAAEDGIVRRKKDPVPCAPRKLMPADALVLRGRHNHANALAALALARAIGTPMNRMLHALRSFAGEPHRCSLVARVRDVEYIDDSKGTNVGATVAALEGLGRRVWLIAGGEGKGQDFAPLAEPVRRHAAAVLLIGRDAPQIREAIADTGVSIVECDSLEAAVQLAAERAQAGDAVLLSPACASFDMFRNYEHRAQVYVDAVRRIAEDAGVAC